MTMTRWKRQYYPTPADKPMTDLEAVAHALRKWKGLMPAILADHGLTFDEGHRAIVNKHKSSVFYLNGTTCALCEVHRNDDENGSCRGCPLFEVRGGVQCDDTMPYEKMSPYDAMCEKQNPRPMIMWLEMARAHVLATTESEEPETED